MVAAVEGDVSGTTNRTATETALDSVPLTTIGDAAIATPPPSASVASDGITSASEGSLDVNATAPSSADFSTTFA